MCHWVLQHAMHHLRCEHRVQNHTCVPCDRGEYNPENHDASGPDTTCDIIQCAENEYVSNHMCQACPAGTYILPMIRQVDPTLYVIEPL